MMPERFLQVVKEQREFGDALLKMREGSYAREGDRLHNFKKAAALESKLPELALSGMMAKQIVALYDYLADLDKGIDTPAEAWIEKITDSINYLYLLRALLEDTGRISSPWKE